VVAPRIVRERRVGLAPGDAAYPRTSAFEPSVATHPTDPDRLAVVYQRFARGATCGIDTPVRVSHDGGATWRTAPGRPYAGSGRGPNIHAVIAWGPGPRPGSARLYWADLTAPGCDYGRLALSVAYSDDEGRTWSRLYVERRTGTWIGGFPEIVVDRNPASPGHGSVYVVYNWLADRTTGPGMRVIASSDFGRSWGATVDVPPASRPAGCPASWRIGYRAATAPDGSLVVSGYQADLRRWDVDRPFAKGGLANVCRLGITVTRVRFDRERDRLTAGRTVLAARIPRSPQAVWTAPAAGTAATVIDPAWCHGLAVDPADGAVYLAVGSYASRTRPGVPRGTVRLGTSRDGGRTWRWRTLPAVTLPGTTAAGGGLASAYRPVVAARDGTVVVGFHAITDPRGSARRRVVVGTYVAVSTDGGRTFAAPLRTTPTRWPAAVLERGTNGPGLRDDVDLLADGRAVFVYGDGRLAARSPSPSWGRSAIYAAVIDP
jgi:hypothetical protein